MGRNLLISSAYALLVPLGTLIGFDRAGVPGGLIGFATGNFFSLLVAESPPVRWSGWFFPPEDMPPSPPAPA
jgi:hypothetical protein